MSAANHAELLVNGHAILPSLLADIRAATTTVHVSIFLWFRDPVGEEVADALIERANAGVTVRVLLNVEKTAMGDPFSTGEAEMMKHDPSMKHDPTDVKPLCERMTRAGIEVHDTNIDYDRKLPGLNERLESLSAQISDAIDIDDLHIDHRKIVVIDGRIAYAGGANIGAQYMHHVPFDPTKEAKQEGEERKNAGLVEPWWKWHDSLTRFEGPIATDLDHAFHERFVLDGGQDFDLPIRAKGDAPAPRGFPVRDARILCNSPTPEPNEVREKYVELIRRAERSIFIENPYLYHPALIDALCEAKGARPGLAVTIIGPAREYNDNEFSQDAQQYCYARYLEHGIDVYEYACHFTHMKLAVFDERFSIHGSTNGNFRSLEDDKDFELVVLVDDEPFARHVLEVTRDVDVGHARRITPADLDGSFTGFRMRHRDPRTLYLVTQRIL
ncbi:MAG TPA: phosphatidylserine/phosphatidylglycerophosphate/cardiolipin synthase family protein [Polyangiaceae bacterium]|jgi:cardiolipin synthase|nr:phosphatidylserine/phosphatidylglycerophosphate/cardiolipin synthase family protein [Polyangiaceae bacterium]